MTRVDSSAWSAKARKRKAYRDFARDKFFKDVALSPHSSIDEHKGAPSEQASKISALLSLTGAGDLMDAEHRAMLQAVSGMLSATGLGAGGQMAGLSKTQDVMTNYTMSKLRKDWFWSPAFFD